jgi:nucleotide-binding universal stress UspA family protein
MRNILLFIDDLTKAESLAKKALKVARQSRANLHLCNAVKTKVQSRLLVHHYDDELALEENEEFNLKELALKLKNADFPEGAFRPAINCVEMINFNPVSVREMVIRHNVWMVIMGEQGLEQLKNADTPNTSIKMINNINCPVLIMPDTFDMSYFNRVVYVTDLRYCDLGVIRFLKVLNAQLFVTHISAPGLPDLEERYAQDILSEEISVKANYQKIFLRNIKNKNIKGAIDYVVDTVEAKMLALVNKKHQTVERLYDSYCEKNQLYQKLPALIFPYLNWFNQASFYE